MRRKRLMRIFLALVTTLTMLPAAVFADTLYVDGEVRLQNAVGDIHSHVYTESVRPATCVTDGLRTFTCECGDSYTETIPATGEHTPETIPAVAATCETPGKTEGSRCSVCGATLTEPSEIPAKGHSWDSGTATTAATCTTDGVRTFTCTTCGATYTEAIPATGNHTWNEGTVTTAATCTTDGVKTFTCTVCGATYTEAIPKTGHTPEKIPAVAVTCEKNGKTEGEKCSVCGEILTEQKEIIATGHEWGPWQSGKEPTCTEKGKDYSVCKNCGQTKYRDNIEPLGHDWDDGVITKEPGITEDGEITYTCRRDPSHTKTEVLPAAGTSTFQGGSSANTLLNNMRNIPPNIPDNALVITEHPQGGTVPSDGSGLILTVAAEGGVPPYTYEWHYRDLDNTDSLWNDWMKEKAKAISDDYNKKKQSSAAAFAAAFQQLYPDATVSYTKPTYSYSGTITEGAACIPDPTDKTLGFYDSPEIYGFGHCEFWCIVRDAAGNTARSDSAEVRKPLGIDVQPRNTNMNGQESVTLECVAKGGLPPYSYQWFNAAGQSMGRGETLTTISVNEVGEYFCMVLDMEDSVYSDIVKVFDAEPFTVTPAYKSYEMSSQIGSTDVKMTVSGGVKPYLCEWQLNYDQELSLFTTEESQLTWKATEAGCYTLLVMDATGAVMSAESEVRIIAETTPQPQNTQQGSLHIIQQPKAVTTNGGKIMMICRAEARDNQNGNLLYIWQRCDKGKWKYYDCGPNLKSVMSGKYGCKVVDTRTGETVWSKTTTVKVKMKFVSARRKGKQLSVKFKGGSSPFTIDLYRKTKSGEKYYKTVQFKSKQKTNHQKIIKVPNKKYRYKIVINDSKGQACMGTSKK